MMGEELGPQNFGPPESVDKCPEQGTCSTVLCPKVGITCGYHQVWWGMPALKEKLR